MCIVTVLMSVYNEKIDYLKEAVNDILSQTLKEIEFLIYDDCSDRTTQEYLIQCAKRDSRIVYMRNDINKGLTSNLYNGIKIAKGKYIARMDSDDKCRHDRLEKQVMFMEKRPDIMMVSTSFYMLYEDKMMKHKKCINNTKAFRTRLLFENSYILHSSVMIRREFLIKNNINYTLAIKKTQDYDLWTKIIKKGNIYIMPERLCTYRVHKSQISYAKADEQKKYRNKIIENQLQDLICNLTDKEKNIHLAIINCNKIYNTSDKIRWIYKLGYFIYKDKNGSVLYYILMIGKYEILYFRKRVYALCTHLNNILKNV